MSNMRGDYQVRLSWWRLDLEAATKYICIVFISFRGYWFFPWQIYHETFHTEAVASANNLLAARLRNELASGSRGGIPEVHSSRSTLPKHGVRSSHSPSPQSKPGGTKREVENEDACLNAHNFNSIHRQLHWDRSVHSIVCVSAVFVSFSTFFDLTVATKDKSSFHPRIQILLRIVIQFDSVGLDFIIVLTVFLFYSHGLWVRNTPYKCFRGVYATTNGAFHIMMTI